jgi:hypothetical protein
MLVLVPGTLNIPGASAATSAKGRVKREAVSSLFVNRL